MSKHQARETRRANEIKRQIAAYQHRLTTPQPKPRKEPFRRGTPGPLKVNVLKALGLVTGVKPLTTQRAAGRWLNRRRHKH